MAATEERSYTQVLALNGRIEMIRRRSLTRNAHWNKGTTLRKEQRRIAVRVETIAILDGISVSRLHPLPPHQG
jgi:hypothetical protein